MSRSPSWGVDKPSEYVNSKKVLERLGVPAGVIRVLPESAVDAAEEVRVIGAEMRTVAIA
jgi:hypothetical protein